jgi:hypothetical protein
MPATNELAADATPRSTLFALMEAPNRRRNWRFGRSLQFHGPAWESLDSADVATLLQRPAQRPHVNVQDIARLLGEASRDDAAESST